MSNSDPLLQNLLQSSELRMSKSLENMKHNMNGLRTGRASIALLDSVKVEAYGNYVPINQVGNISTPEARLIVVQVWDKDLARVVDKAIRESDLGLNPSTDGNTIRVPLPDLTEERRKELVKTANRYCEEAKIAIRNIRRDANDALKKSEKNKEISEDQLKDFMEKVQKLTDALIKEADSILEVKSKDIMKV
jgi:ribosome recycling factor